MWLTKAGAVKKLCPFTFNKTDQETNFDCAGPSCMAWRWGSFPTDESKKFGFCGLANKPINPINPIAEKESGA